MGSLFCFFLAAEILCLSSFFYSLEYVLGSRVTVHYRFSGVTFLFHIN
jgi:hypothetical protein